MTSGPPAAILAIASLLVVLQPITAFAQQAQSLFNGHNLDGWKLENAQARVRDTTIRVESSRGWLRTTRPFADFVLTFEMRMGEGGKAGVFVRGWPTFDDKSNPANAFRLTKAFLKAGADARWEQWRIECSGRSIRLLIDGMLAYTAETVANPQGYVGLWARDGAAEFRSIEIREARPRDVEVPGVVSLKSVAAIPKLLREVKPAYTRAAMEQRIQGTVWIAAVVEVDGTVGDLFITRSLDTKHGLDESARSAAKAWRFVPAMVDGAPVRTLVTIELMFTLK